MELDYIECSLRPKERFECLFGKRGEKTKLGSYHGSYFWCVKGFGRDRWVVTLIVEGVDVDAYLGEGLSEEEIVNRCMNFLNQPVGKRKKRQPYGNLEVLKTTAPAQAGGGMKARFEIKDDKCIVLLAVTDQQRNKNFWGKGQKVSGAGRTRKNSAKRK